HYLPVLWYRFPIPNEIREFWYSERPDILEYMQKAYKDLDIQFLPDTIVQQLNQQKLTGFHQPLMNSLSTELLSKDDFFQTDSLFGNLDFIHNLFLNF
ncbi:MAG: hypothetical protein ACRCXZ_06415, partial [Patescibacteria group bacterium]